MYNMEIFTRAFNWNNIEALASLTNELGYETTVADMKVRMENILTNSNYKTIVATINDKIVGYIGLNKNFFWEQNGHFIRVQALVVKAECRKGGVGRKLIESAEAWAKEVDAKLIVLN
jgi:N-acetylglutamate synthase-like GNAT family acetyltransferase